MSSGRIARKHHLTDEQKQLAGDNIWLVWWFMKKAIFKGAIRREEMDEASGYVIWHYCMACEGFDPNHGVKFSSYVSRAFWSGINRYKQLKAINDRHLKIGLGSGSEDDPEEQNYIKIKSCGLGYSHLSGNNVKWGNIKFLFENVNMSPIEEQVIYFYHEEKMNFKEVGCIVGFTKERVRQIYSGIIDRVKDYVNSIDLSFEDCVA